MNQPTPQKNKDIQQTSIQVQFSRSESFRMKFLAHAQTFDRGGGSMECLQAPLRTPSSPDRSRLVPLALDYTRLSRPKPNREPVRRLSINLPQSHCIKRKKCQVTRRKELFYFVTSGSNVTHDVHICVTVDYQQIENDNIANQIHGFTIDYGKFILSLRTGSRLGLGRDSRVQSRVKVQGERDEPRAVHITTLCINDFKQNRPTFFSKSAPVSRAEGLKSSRPKISPGGVQNEKIENPQTLPRYRSG